MKQPLERWGGDRSQAMIILKENTDPDMTVSIVLMLVFFFFVDM